MKNLSLKSLNLREYHLLKRDQLKSVLGGYESEGCAYQGGNGYAGQVGPNMSSSEAQYGASQTGGYWCCASCCDVGWLDDDQKQYIGC